MDIQIETLIAVYKDELQRLQNENIILKAKLLQIDKEMQNLNKRAVDPNIEEK